ncbi:uncharacterized protein B4U79_07967 [Dinothrombium tinctorium]|uniref:Ig-like domain-containing protein n=1 Tax=Dinothrombium tinctorium TaxID=1965070 RepID=A0A443RDB7_9ACAR|nr:uncharacterized protein B4U79_07967 [Dinothrombium tinctorium]
MDANGNLEQARTLTAASLEGRAYFNLHNRPAFLQIDPIRLSDAGDYRCRVDFKKARTVNTVISLKVIVPPDEPRVANVEGVELKGLIGPFNEGDELKLICTTNGGKPRPSLTWWRDFAIIDDSFEYNDKDVTTNQLTIPSLARHHLLSIFMCQAVNNNITVASQTSITLDLNLKPTDVQITQLTPLLVADKEATFECQAFGSRPKAILYWLFDGQRHNTPLNGDHQTRTTITITPKRVHSGDHLTCIAENSKIPNSAISAQLKLDIQYIPRLSLQLGSPTISLNTIQEGNDIYFDCHIDANPPPNKPILWRFNGNVLHPQQGICPTCELSIDSSFYLSLCVAKNDVGLQQKPCTFEIIAGGPPQFPFNCQVVNQSDNALVILCLYNVHSNKSSDRVKHQPSTLYVYPQTFYICEVYDQTSSYLVANVSTTLVLPYLPSSSDTSNNNMQFLVTNLQAATHFKIRIYSQNARGKSDETWLKAQTLRPAERLIDNNTSGNNASGLNTVNVALLRGKPMLIALLIGVAVVTVIVLALGIIAVLRVRRSNNSACDTPPVQPQPQQSGAATMFNEEDEDCCCDEDCCDEMLLTSSAMQQQCNNSKGPPDIIPSFGYSSSGLENKQFLSYGKQSTIALLRPPTFINELDK